MMRPVWFIFAAVAAGAAVVGFETARQVAYGWQCVGVLGMSALLVMATGVCLWLGITEHL
jgi:hypothetical protein